ncbi:murein transglycosylase A [Dongia sp.]|uniref:murein transglycosylase A n=1 Tax=Dongia sp. TaxID=1977262 RepID=UPI0037523DA9
MQARQAGQQRRTGKRRSQPHRPGAPHKGKQRSVKHPVAKKRAARKSAQLAALRKLLHHGRHSFTLASLGLLMLVASCATPRVGEAPDHSLALVATDFDSLPGWERDRLAEALPALQNSCAAFAKWPDDKAVGKLGGQAGDWRAACSAAMQVQAGDNTGMAIFLKTYFQPYRALDRTTDQGLFTSYYETELDGARARGGAYTVPLYKAPDPPVTFTRAQIDNGALAGKGLELMWLKDPVDAWMLHIQGSSVVKLPDGKITRIGYAGNNGQDFVPVARLMIQEGLIPKGQASMQSVRSWLQAHPAEAQTWMQKNPRYIFFRELDSSAGLPTGPNGALGVTLTPTRSMAVDPAYMPLGVPVWLDTQAPDGTPLQRLMVAQDVGSAIKGPIRGDLFWGTGETALEFAGRMKNSGRYYVLLPKTVATRNTLTVSELNTDGSN